MKQMGASALAPKISERLLAKNISSESGVDLEAAITLYVERCQTLNALANALLPFYGEVTPNADLLAQHLVDAARPALSEFVDMLATVEWSAVAIGAALKEVLKRHGLKMPQLAMPLRVILLGVTETPSVDAVIALLGQERVLARLSGYR
jgi:glutamyl-tRNA synthetase